MKTNIVVHAPSGAILAAVTSHDPRLLDEIVGDALPLVAEFDAEIPVPKDLLLALALDPNKQVILDPFAQYVVAGDEPPTPKPVVARITIDISAPGSVKAVIPTNLSGTYGAWFLVKRDGEPLTQDAQVIGPGNTVAAFHWVHQAGDVVLAIVEQHRPEIIVA